MACGEGLTNIFHIHSSLDLKMADMGRPNFVFNYHGDARDSTAVKEITIMKALGVIKALELDDGFCTCTCGGKGREGKLRIEDGGNRIAGAIGILHFFPKTVACEIKRALLFQWVRVDRGSSKE